MRRETYNYTIEDDAYFPGNWTKEQAEYAMKCRKELALLILRNGPWILTEAAQTSVIDQLICGANTGLRK
jgi:hypothetical protein